MKTTIKFFSKDFKHEISKKAYLKACAWIAKNIINEVEIGETFFKIRKLEPNESDSDLPTFRLELYAVLDTKDLKQDFCTKCKEYHHSFYLNQEYNCNSCNKEAYIKQAETKLRIKKNYNRQILAKEIEIVEDEEE